MKFRVKEVRIYSVNTEQHWYDDLEVLEDELSKAHKEGETVNAKAIEDALLQLLGDDPEIVLSEVEPDSLDFEVEIADDVTLTLP